MIATLCAIAILATVKDVDLSTSAQHGQAYFQAEEFDQAATCYQQLLEARMQQDQREIVRYNLGTIYLKQENYDRALTEFDQVHLGNDPLPHFGKQLRVNQGIACLKKALYLIQEREDSAPFLNRCEEALKFLKKGLEGYREAVEYSRQIVRLEGGAAADQEELKELHEQLKSAIAEVKKRAEAFVRSQRSLQESLELLAKEMKETLVHIEKMDQEKCDATIKTTKYALESNRLKKRNEDWHDLFKHEKQGEIIQQLFQYYVEGVAQLAGNRSLEGHVSLTKALGGVDLLCCQEKKEDVLDRALQFNLETAEKLNRESPANRLSQAYEQEAIYLREVSKQLCREYRFHFQEEGEEAELKRKLLQLLGDRLETPKNEPLKAVEQSGEELWHYRLVAQNEEEVLLNLCSEMRKGENSKTWPWRMRALVLKFSARSEFAKDEILRHRFKDIEETLSTAVEELPSPDRALSLVEGALRSLNPMKWVQMKISELYRTENEELKSASTPKLMTKLKKDHEEMLHHLQEPDIMQKSGDMLRPLQQSLEFSLYDLRIGEQQLARSVAPLFRICLEDSEKWLWRSKSMLEGKDPHSADEILTRAIEEQHHVLQVNQRMSPFIQHRKEEKELAVIPLRGEEYVIALVSPFPQALMAHEKSKPVWPKILELYHKGCKSALLAKEFLGAATPHWSEAANEQKLAEQYWKEALDLLKDPDSSNQGDQEQNSNAPSETSGGGAEEEKKQQEAEKPSQAPNFFELLQQMEQEDMEKNKSQVKPKQGARPW